MKLFIFSKFNLNILLSFKERTFPTLFYKNRNESTTLQKIIETLLMSASWSKSGGISIDFSWLTTLIVGLGTTMY